MRVERVSINKKCYYFVDSVKITDDALNAVIKGVYGADVCRKMYRDLFGKNIAIVERYVGDVNSVLLEQLDCAKEKIAALEKKVEKLTRGDWYAKLPPPF